MIQAKASRPGDSRRGEALKNLAVSLGGMAVPEISAASEMLKSGAPWWLAALGFFAALYLLKRRK